jgi:uncharacterized protein involved in outer membrane biogenesis
MYKDFNEKILKFAQDCKKYRDIILASKAIRLSSVIIGIVIFLLFITPLFFDNSMLKFSMIQKISRATNADFDINGDIEVSFLPTPTIKISEAVLLNYKHKPTFSKEEELFNFYAKNIKIKFSIFDIYDDILASEIEFDDGFFEVFSDPKNIPNRNNKITDVLVGYKKLPAVSPTESGLSVSNKIFKFSEIIDDDFRHYLSKIPAIRMKNCSFSFFNKLGKNKDFNNINAILNFSTNYSFAKGSFASEKINSKFEYQAIFNDDSAKPKSYLYLSSPNLEMKIKGNYTGENKGPLASDFKGDMNINITELKSFYQTYFANEKSHIFGKLKSSNNPIIIKSNIENALDEFNLKNIEIDSPIINGSGDLYFAIHDQLPILDLNLNLNNLDLDSIISQEALKIENYELAKTIEDINIKKNIAINNNEIIASNSKLINPNQPTNPPANLSEKTPSNMPENIPLDPANPLNNTKSLNNLDLISSFKHFDVITDIKIKNLKFFETDFKDCDIYLTLNKTGEIMILPAIIKTPGEGSFYIRGIVENTQIPKFVGSVDYKGKNLGEILKWLNVESSNTKFENFGDFRLYANLLMLPNYTYLNEIYFNLNKNETEIFGESKIIRENKNTAITSDFEITNFNFDKHFILNSNKNNLTGKASLIKKMMWLNNINSYNQLSLNFNKLNYNQEDFIDQKINLKFNRGFLNIENLALKSSQTDLNLNLVIDISNKTPIIDFKVIGAKLNYVTNVKPTVHKQIENPDSNSTQLKENLNNISEIFRNNLQKNHDFLESFYRIPSLESFNGKIDIDINEINMDHKILKELKFFGDLKNGTIDAIKSSWQAYGGTLNYNGLIDVKENKIINGNVIAKNINLAELFKDLYSIDSIGGTANISANLLSVANSKAEFLEDLKSEIKFNVAQPFISGFGINDLVSKMFNIKFYQKELQFPEKILFNPDAKSFFKQARGNIAFKNNDDGKIRVEFFAPAVNSVLTGSINAEKQNFDWLFNALFLTGSTQKPTPINLAIKIKGSPQEYTNTANTNQIRQYLGLQQQIYQSQFVANKQGDKEEKSSLIESSLNKLEDNNSKQNLTEIDISAPNSITSSNQTNNPEIKKENNSPTQVNPDKSSSNQINNSKDADPKTLPKPREEFKIIEADE